MIYLKSMTISAFVLVENDVIFRAIPQLPDLLKRSLMISAADVGNFQAKLFFAAVIGAAVYTVMRIF